MRKLSYALAAVTALAVVTPTIASASEFSVRVGSDRDYYRDRDYRGPRAGFYDQDRGYHRGWERRGYDDGDRAGVVIRTPGFRADY